MHKRTNPWPAFVDLFSALLIATFAGFIMLAGAYQHELSRYQQAEKEMTRMRTEANKIVQQIQSALNQNSALGSRVRTCQEDTCIDLDIHFKTNDDILANVEETESLKKACEVLKSAIDQLPESQRRDIQLTIEGHTDSTQPEIVYDLRERYLYNWNLSARRATSVSYIFQECGLKPPVYQVVAIGHADSMPVCTENTQKCNDDNRRTTLRLRADTRQIEERLKQSQ